MQVVKKSSLPTVQLGGQVLARIFEGNRHGDTTVSAFIVDAPVGTGPRRHHHPYDEVFIVLEGTVRLEAGGETIDVTPEEVSVVRAGVPHAFTNLGPGRAVMVNVHAAADVVTEFVDPVPEDSSYRYHAE
jgi:mannose-6-phosphate isomerase-like protein (cupin superfamily)